MISMMKNNKKKQLKMKVKFWNVISSSNKFNFKSVHELINHQFDDPSISAEPIIQ